MWKAAHDSAQKSATLNAQLARLEEGTQEAMEQLEIASRIVSTRRVDML